MMSNPLFLGIGGRYEAGKDVVAEYLEREYDFEVLGFSNPLNEALMVLDPIVLVSMELGVVRYSKAVQQRGFTGAKEIPEVRRLLQFLGTEVGRAMIGPDVWVDMLQQKVEDYLDAGRSVVLTGVRYENELEMVRRVGGDTVWIERPSTTREVEHSSENSLSADDFEYVLVNDTSILELENEAGKLVEDLRD